MKNKFFKNTKRLRIAIGHTHRQILKKESIAKIGDFAYDAIEWRSHFQEENA